GFSYWNDSEVRLARRLLESWRSQLSHCTTPITVGVITGYEAQKLALLRSIDPTDSHWWPLQIEVNTVDAFQGRERDLIIYSAVRSNPRGDIGFLSDVRRLNVALSRAREFLVIVGDDSMLRIANGPSGNNPFRKVIDWIRTHHDTCEFADGVR